MSLIIERSMEMKTNVTMYFVDYAKAFDRVKHEELFRILNGLSMDGKDLRIRKRYWDSDSSLMLEQLV